MSESLEERVQDLEQLVLRQNERIDMLEQRLETAMRLVMRTAAAQGRTPDDEAA